MRFSQIRSSTVPLDPPDLSDFAGEELTKCLSTVERWQKEPAALLTMLIEIQEIWGYLPERVLEYVSYALKIPRVDLFAILEFYDLLHPAPPGPRLGLCMNTSCTVRGGGRVAELLSRTLARRPDIGLSLEEVPCQGCCDLAPVAVSEGSPFRLTPAAAARLAPTLLKTSPQKAGGQVWPTPTQVTYRNLHRPESHRLEVFRAHGGYTRLEQVVRNLSPEAVIAAIAESGLRGAGGAGFPTWRKWEAVRRAKGAEKVVVVNADEGEPGTFKDRPILERDPHLLIEGTAIAAHTVGASQGFIYLRGEYRLARERLACALKEAEAAGFLGDRIRGSPFSFRLHLRLGAGSYVAGEETALLESLEGRPALPRVRPPYPSDWGLFGRPTLVNNVETLAAVPSILEKGPAWYRDLGRNGSSGVKIYSLSGDVARPGNYELPRGITARELIFGYGGGLRRGKRLKAFLVGGASGGFLPPEALDIPLEIAPLRAKGADLGSGAVVVVGEGNCLFDLARRETHFFAKESCGACDPCRLGTQALLKELDRLLDPTIRSQVEARIQELGAVLLDSSRCGLGQAAANPLLSVIRHFPGEITAHAEDHCPASICGKRLGRA
ncbi:MAG: NAD(P)H-dependent oxidoreductase subunit E [Candidatus Methylomirabilales bacterium]